LKQSGDSNGEVRKAVALTMTMFLISAIGIAFLIHLIGLNSGPLTGISKMFSVAIKNIKDNVSYMVKIIKVGCRTFPGLKKFLVFIILLLLIAIPVEFLTYIKRRR